MGAQLGSCCGTVAVPQDAVCHERQVFFHSPLPSVFSAEMLTALDSTDQLDTLSDESTQESGFRDCMPFETLTTPTTRVLRELAEHCLAFPAPDRPHIMAAFSEAYVARCISEPHRTLESHTEKLKGCATWRAERRPWAITQHAAPPELLRWHGRSVDGKAVLHARPGLVGSVDPDVLDRAHIWALEHLIRSGETSFYMVVDTSGVSVRHISPDLMRRMNTLVSIAYRGRMELCLAGPTGSVARWLWELLRALLPERVAHKVHLCASPREELLRRGVVEEGAIPDHLP